MNEVVGHKLSSATELAIEIGHLQREIHRLRPEEPAAGTPTRAVDELQALLDDQIVQTERKRVEIEERRRTVKALEAQLVASQEAVKGLQGDEAELARQLAAKAKEQAEDKDGRVAYHRQLAELCQWHSKLAAMMTELTGCKAELLRPGHLLLTVASPDGSASVPVHMNVCMATGRLLGVQIGTTSATPHRQWRDVVEMAIETNNIPYLARQVRAALHASQ